MLRKIIIGFLLLVFGIVQGQRDSTLEIVFNPILNGVALLDNETSHSNQLNIETLKFYLSNFELYKGEEFVSSVNEHYYLLDLEKKESWKIPISIPKEETFSHIKFQIGVDSLINVSGAMGGDLDPVHGMYWTWQSGYINFKLEGTSVQCPARNNKFQYHVGGFQAPFETVQELSLAIDVINGLVINVNLDKIFENIEVSSTYRIMSPNKTAVEFAKFIPTIFSVKE